MNKRLVFAFTFSFVSLVLAQDPVPTVAPESQTEEEVLEENVLLVDLDQFCPDVPVEEKTEEVCLVCEQKKAEADFMPMLDQFSLNVMNTLAGEDKERKEACLAMNKLKMNPKFIEQQPINIQFKDDTKNTWSLKLFFGYTRAKYGNSDMTVESSKINGTFEDFKFKERSSFNYFNPKELKGKGNTFRFLDEPTSTFGLIMEKGKHVLIFSVFHLKYLKENNQTVNFKGTVNGVEVDGPIQESTPFDGNYNLPPDQMHLRRFENTWWQINPQFGYGRKINIVGNEKTGKLSYTPYAQAGFVLGTNFSAYKSDASYWDTDEYQTGLKFKGVTGSVGHRIEYEKGRGSLFLDHKVTVAKMNHAFLDGTAKYNIMFSPLTLGAGFKIIKEKKKKVPVEDP